MKNDITTNNTISPVNPPCPKALTKSTKFAITSIPNIDPPVNTVHKIVTGRIAIKIPTSPPTVSYTHLTLPTKRIV